MSVSPVAQAEDHVEELSYQDLVDQLREKRRRISLPHRTTEHPMDNIALHMNFGLATNLNAYRVNDRSISRAVNGFQIGLGIDLFSPEWRAEFAIRNFGTRETGSESHNLRELDLKVLYRHPWADKMNYRLGSGLTTRYIRFTDSINQVNISQESPNLLLMAGLDTPIAPHLVLGGEISARSALSDQNIDRNSLDLMLRMETSF